MSGYKNKVKNIKKQLSRFNLSCTVKKIIQHGHKRQDNTPWTTAKLIEWSIFFCQKERGQTPSDNEISKLLKEVWELQGNAVCMESESVEQFMRPFVMGQVKFNEPARRSFDRVVRLGEMFRYYSECEVLIGSFEEYCRMPWKAFLGISTNILCVLKSRNIKTFEEIIYHCKNPYPPTLLARYLSLFTTNVETISSDEYFTSGNVDPGRERNYFIESPLYERPIISVNGNIHIVNRHLFAISISDFFTRTFTKIDQVNSVRFGDIFEHYIHKISREYDPDYKDETWLSLKLKKNKSEVADGYFGDQAFGVVVESKSVHPKPKEEAYGSVNGIIYKAVGQIASTYKELTASGDVPADISNRYGLIVTHRDFFAGTGISLLDFAKATDKEKALNKCDGVIDIKNIHAIALEDYEILLANIDTHEIKIFLDFVKKSESGKINNRVSLRHHVEAFLNGRELREGLGTFPADKERCVIWSATSIVESANFWNGMDLLARCETFISYYHFVVHLVLRDLEPQF